MNAWRCSTTGARSTGSRARRRSPVGIAIRQSPNPQSRVPSPTPSSSRWATPSAPVRFRSRSSTTCSPPSARTSSRSATGRGQRCWTTAGDRRIPSAGSCCAWRATRMRASTAPPTPCAPRCSSPTSGRTSSATGGRAASTCPREDCERFGASEADLDARVISSAWRDVLSEMAARTRRLFAEGRAVCDGLSGRLRYELRLTWLGGMRILDRLEQAGFDVFTARPTLGSLGRPGPSLGRGRLEAAAARLSIAMARRDTNFYYSFVVLPEHKRRAIIAVWDFCRAVDDAVDERAGQLGTRGVEAGGGRVDRRLARRTGGVLRGPAAAHTAGRGPGAPHRAFKLPRQPFEDVIDGVEMDLDRPRFRTFDDLRGYCLRVASAVGLVCIEIFGYTNPRCRQYAIDLGIALQLTNILRDLGRDLDAGRLYLPTEDLDALRRDRGRPPRRPDDRPDPRAARLRGEARAGLLPPGGAGTAARGRQALRGRPHHGRDLPQPPRADRNERLRRVRRAHPRAALAPGDDRRLHLARRRWPVSDMPTATPTSSSSAAASRGSRAATALAERGARVTVVEARPHLGGRASSFVDPSTGETVDNGQHILMGCYRETFAFLRRIGAMSNVRVQPSLSVPTIDTAGRRSVLSCPPLPAPWHLLGGVMEWDALGWRDRLSVLRLGTPVRTAQRRLRGSDRPDGRSPEETVENWLIRNGQTPRLREMLWDPLALAALNQPPRRGGGARVRAGAGRDVRPRPAGRLHRLPGRAARRDVCGAGPATSSRRGAGASAPTPSRASSTEGDRAVGVRTRGGREVRARAIVSAVPWFALRPLFDEVPPRCGRSRRTRRAWRPTRLSR